MNLVRGVNYYSIEASVIHNGWVYQNQCIAHESCDSNDETKNDSSLASSSMEIRSGDEAKYHLHARSVLFCSVRFVPDHKYSFRTISQARF